MDGRTRDGQTMDTPAEDDAGEDEPDGTRQVASRSASMASMICRSVR